jgi:CheY-like chemotaxis protein
MSKASFVIVFIDDDPWMRDLYGFKLKEDGFRVYIGENGKEGVGLVLKHNPDLVLTDLVMPKGDGYFVIKKLKGDAKTKDIPVVALTNISSEADRSQCLELGANGYLVKVDYTPSEVVKEIQKFFKNDRTIQ